MYGLISWFLLPIVWLVVTTGPHVQVPFTSFDMPYSWTRVVSAWLDLGWLWAMFLGLWDGLWPNFLAQYLSGLCAWIYRWLKAQPIHITKGVCSTWDGPRWFSRLLDGYRPDNWMGWIWTSFGLVQPVKKHPFPSLYIESPVTFFRLRVDPCSLD